ncbi:MAG: universal stress protein [Bacteroidales bacterium]|nr:universal stress protein [Bacteroidales bacterium]
MPGTTALTAAPVDQAFNEIAEMEKEAITRNTEMIRAEFDSPLLMDYSFEIGFPQYIIEEHVVQNKADMVILEGESIFWPQKDFNMDVIRSVKCPVWVIPRPVKYKPLKEVVYATDYKEEDISTLKKLIPLTKPFEPNITALHVTDNRDFNEKVTNAGFAKLVRDKTGYDNISIKTIRENGSSNIAELVNDFSLMLGAQLIVVLKENNGFMERLFKSSTTKEIINEARLPVLVYHEQTTSQRPQEFQHANQNA